MKNIAWAGGTDVRTLNADDLAKAGVDLSNAKVQEFTFPVRESVEVTNEVATAIMEHPEIFGRFTMTEEDAGETLDFDALNAEKTEADAGKTSLETPQTGVDTPAAPRRGGARTSTASTT